MIAVDLDGTLAEYHGFVSECHIGDPIPLMVDRVKAWINEGKAVIVFTARLSPEHEGRNLEAVRQAIRAWTAEHIGQPLEATCVKSYAFEELWDDRAVSVAPNNGTAFKAEVRANRAFPHKIL